MWTTRTVENHRPVLARAPYVWPPSVQSLPSHWTARTAKNVVCSHNDNSGSSGLGFHSEGIRSIFSNVGGLVVGNSAVSPTFAGTVQFLLTGPDQEVTNVLVRIHVTYLNMIQMTCDQSNPNPCVHIFISTSFCWSINKVLCSFIWTSNPHLFFSTPHSFCWFTSCSFSVSNTHIVCTNWAPNTRHHIPSHDKGRIWAWTKTAESTKIIKMLLGNRETHLQWKASTFSLISLWNQVLTADTVRRRLDQVSSKISLCLIIVLSTGDIFINDVSPLIYCWFVFWSRFLLNVLFSPQDGAAHLSKYSRLISIVGLSFFLLLLLGL